MRQQHQHASSSSIGSSDAGRGRDRGSSNSVTSFNQQQQQQQEGDYTDYSTQAAWLAVQQGGWQQPCHAPLNPRLNPGGWGQGQGQAPGSLWQRRNAAAPSSRRAAQEPWQTTYDRMYHPPV